MLKIKLLVSKYLSFKKSIMILVRLKKKMIWKNALVPIAKKHKNLIFFPSCKKKRRV